MSVFIAPSEPIQLKAVQTGPPIGMFNPEKFGCDVIWFVNGVVHGCQRKETSDLLASLADGRIEREVALMEEKLAGRSMLIIEGQWRWTTDGFLLDAYNSKFNKSALWGIEWSLQRKGIWVMRTRNLDETVELVKAFPRWASKPSHTSLDRRPKAKGQFGTGDKASYRRRGVHLLQSFESVGPTTAERIFDYFERVPLRWTVDAGELAKVPGIGRPTAQKLIDSL